jgi:hypothetical protein
MRSIVVAVLTAFLVLKLTGLIAWSWWWVLSPLWIPIALGFSAVLFVVVILFLFAAIAAVLAIGSSK